jgi:hypothetical protein
MSPAGDIAKTIKKEHMNNDTSKTEKATSAIETPQEKKRRRFFDIDLEGILKLVGLLFAAITASVALVQYMSAQKWKVAELSTIKLNEFYSNPSVRIVNKLLDGKNCIIQLDSNTSRLVTQDAVIQAMTIDTVEIDFSPLELKIRNIFDDYFYQLSFFNGYAKTELIDYDKMKPYLETQIRVIADRGDPRKSEEFKQQLQAYINYYGFSDIKELYSALGYPIENALNETRNHTIQTASVIPQ